MISPLNGLLAAYSPTTAAQHVQALREIIQYLALLGLWRVKFHHQAAFYGGTCLRIFYDLPRFSEDLDFSLLKPEPSFDLTPFLKAIESELAAFGFSMTVEHKHKQNRSSIESAFIKGNTLQNVLRIGAPEELVASIHGRAELKVKMELDVDPPPAAQFEVKTLLRPIPFQVRLFELADLMAGKMHALLCRKWKRRVKGRDFYDFIWYIGRKVPCRLEHLRARMVQSGHWPQNQPLEEQVFKRLLRERFLEVDFQQARDDVRPFVQDPQALDLWSQEFFVSLVEQVQTC